MVRALRLVVGVLPVRPMGLHGRAKALAWRPQMESVLRVWAAIMICAAVTQTSSAEDDAKVGIGVGMDYVSKYIWRGQNLQDDGAIQPSALFTYGSLTASIWGSIDLSKINNNSGEITEVDYSLDYTTTLDGLDGLTWSFGVINYTFPNTHLDDTTELYAGVGLDVPLTPKLTLYRDVDDYDGTYIMLSVGHCFEKFAELAPDVPVGLTLGACLGWGSDNYNAGYWGVSHDALNDLTFSLGLPMKVGRWSVTPSIRYTTLINSDIRDSDAYDTASDYFVVGVGVTTSF